MSKAKWDERFSEVDYTYGEHPNAFIKEKADLLSSGATIGAFAEGEGRNAVYLATLGHTVTAYDQSTVGLQKTKQLAERHHVSVHTEAADLTKNTIPADLYDAAIMVFGHVPKEDQHFFIQNIIQSVKRGGLILFEVYSESQLTYQTGGPPSIDHLYDPAEILAWIKPYTCRHFYYGEAERHEGARHTGTGHVIQVVIQK
ncbi:class I SAM-dependent methyltransferase [Lentibacillus saliphilus]|uniref:class I SAM-dependent methyltransferase n=1 Tax=Lentibacillus saliphilus TaxID=2737028 RepID=UPI001C2FF849|nr:class I SAM-dependent methyltransferase [Lentibacillus saliphilus]